MAPPKLLELEQDEELARLVSGWDFDTGKRFQDKVLTSLNSSVHHPSSPSGSFSLLAIFRRYTFRLTVESVSLALHACLGGTPAGFHVSFIRDRHFRFSVSCKQVGFMVCDLKRIITEHFDVYFHLWRDGGDSWVREEKKWLSEEAKSWTTVSYKKMKKRNSHGRRVTFKNPIVQESPSKCRTQNTGHQQKVILIGSIECRIPEKLTVCKRYEGKKFTAARKVSSSRGFFHGVQAGCEREVEDDIQVERVFGTLNKELRINSLVGLTSSREKQVHATQLAGAASKQSRIYKACFNCLDLGHIANEWILGACFATIMDIEP